MAIDNHDILAKRSLNANIKVSSIKTFTLYIR